MNVENVETGSTSQFQSARSQTGLVEKGRPVVSIESEVKLVPQSFSFSAMHEKE